MVLIRTHDSFMKIYDRKQHVLLTMETFSISAKTNQARSNGTNFVHKKVYFKNERNNKIFSLRNLQEVF